MRSRSEWASSSRLSSAAGEAPVPACFHDGDVTERYDVIIVGTGAGGGTLAHTLAASGKRILLLERGEFLPREMYNWNPG
ncbi:MAG: NAD(P)-binding protein, partial [Streptosporangiaceae bacterium]